MFLRALHWLKQKLTQVQKPCFLILSPNALSIHGILLHIADACGRVPLHLVEHVQSEGEKGPTGPLFINGLVRNTELPTCISTW